jgi:glycosyltransferase involved in cell wall biosynthesis
MPEMQILIVHNILNDSLSVSGVLKEYAHMANAWIEAGHPTDFLAAAAASAQLQKLAPKSRLVSSDGVFDGTRHLSRTWVSFPAYAYRMLTAHYTRMPKKYDIVYASSPFIVEVYSGIVLSRRQRAKLVVKVQHLLAAQSHRQGFTNRLLLQAERISTRWINRYADLLLCLSRTVGRDYGEFEKALGLVPKKVIPSGCGVDIDAFSKLQNDAKRFEAVILGRIHELKGVLEIPQVWKQVRAQIPDARLVIIGEGPQRSQVEHSCRQLGIAQSITFAGSVSEGEKNRLLSEAKLGLSLSYEEGWGLSVTEFLAAGLPVVAYALPVFNEVFPGQLQIVPPHEQTAMVATIVDLLKNRERRAALGQQGKQFVARYDYRVMAQAELATLSSLLQC